MTLHVEHLLVKDDQAVVELHSLATAKNGMRFDNRYCWVCTFESNCAPFGSIFPSLANVPAMKSDFE
jgi:hypothetical protein